MFLCMFLWKQRAEDPGDEPLEEELARDEQAERDPGGPHVGGSSVVRPAHGLHPNVEFGIHPATLFTLAAPPCPVLYLKGRRRAEPLLSVLPPYDGRQHGAWRRELCISARTWRAAT